MEGQSSINSNKKINGSFLQKYKLTSVQSLVVLVILALGLVLFLGRQINPLQVNVKPTPIILESEVSPTNFVSYHDTYEERSFLNIDGCDKDSCLFYDKFNDAVIGFAMLKGFYTQYSTKERDGSEVVCDTITTISSHPRLVSNLTEWITRGNTVNRLNEKGNLVLNIDLKSLTEIDVQKIKSSNASNIVEMAIIRVMPVARGAAACTPFIDIIVVR